MRRYVSLCALAAFLASFPPTASSRQRPLPVIDVHMHASAADSHGPPPLGVCVGRRYPGQLSVFAEVSSQYQGITADNPATEPYLAIAEQLVWPGVIEASIRIIEEAPFLTQEQQRDILYGNAARFLRLSQAEIDRHNGR